MYHFLSGYTAKVAGTEKGLVGVQPEFSTCFGAPFLPRHPSVYADLLRDYINKHKVDCWLVNSGWTGGKYGVGRRMPIKATRTLLTAALDGSLKNADFRTDPYFGFSVPTSVPGVEPHLLNPFKTWKNKAEFDKTARDLVDMFQKNFAKFEKPRHAGHQGGGAGSAHRGGVTASRHRVPVMKTGAIRTGLALVLGLILAGAAHADCSRLYALAQQHANDMARRNRLDHAGFMTHRGPAGATAENVAVGCADEACARRMWMRSPPHRANMMRGGCHAVASAVSANGRRYWVMEIGGGGGGGGGVAGRDFSVDGSNAP